MTPWQIFRLSANEPRKVVETLLGLYDVDISAFKEDDQYGLDLLKLVLLQPEAFWVATLDNAVIGYLSVFTFRSDRLYKKLLKEAKQGILDLPDLISDYREDMISTPHAKLGSVHIYIDAIAVAKITKNITGQTSELIRRDLINVAKNDLALVNKNSLCAIVVRPSISLLIKKLGIPLEDAGGRRESIVGDRKYRELFCCRNINTKRFNIIMDGLALLRNVRFGFRLGYDQFRGTPSVDVFAEPRD